LLAQAIEEFIELPNERVDGRVVSVGIGDETIELRDGSIRALVAFSGVPDA
jgi:hypothetical protein